MEELTSTRNATNSETVDGMSPVRLAWILASGLMAVIMLINAIGGDVTAIGENEFRELLRKGVIERISIQNQQSLVATLYDREKVKSRQGDYLQSIFVEFSLPIDEVQRQEWRDLGIKVGDGEERVENNTWIWAAIVVGMLGLGIWHLISQARKNLRYGSPRQWLEVVDREFQEGIISKEERDSRIEEISARL